MATRHQHVIKRLGIGHAGPGGRYYGIRTATFVIQITDSTNTTTTVSYTAPYVFNVRAGLVGKNFSDQWSVSGQ